ncbi:hypothetical protein BE04_17515 [Sorangium cellulosum]|uniref:Secreted protein n=2 Tax=Sorangium cellulosum TaxID=56 RepID=A0A150P6J1_SORCE|nr:hypothetical protein [Sorangium cellulosum]AGP40819.1 hypothetical protein SCE1572_43820 [Sorangium cellulosum So0157-2]KYF51295.1 hypothetical protein BE04_17515 [Sorangium cellulosum]
MLFSRSIRTTLASAALPCLASAALLVGCADPEGRFGDFEARDTTVREHQAGSGGSDGTGGGGEGCPPEPGAVDGEFFFNLSARISPRTPIVFVADLTTEASDGGLSFSMTFQPLEAADRRTPTGPSVDVGPYALSEDGTFAAELPTIVVPGNANPISGGELEATITLSGRLCAPADFVCGDVTGTVARPISLDLKGSTFAMERITDPDSYPAAVINCKKDPARPL